MEDGQTIQNQHLKVHSLSPKGKGLLLSFQWSAISNNHWNTWCVHMFFCHRAPVNWGWIAAWCVNAAQCKHLSLSQLQSKWEGVVYLPPRVLARLRTPHNGWCFPPSLSWHLVMAGGQVKRRICWVFLSKWLLAEFDLTYESKFILLTTQNWKRKKSSELFKCMSKQLGKPTEAAI